MPLRVALTQSSSSLSCSRPTPKPPTGGVFDCSLVEERPGFVSVLFEGKGAKRLFRDEAGGHRFQRVPPTEKKGRVHTSTVTVAVLDPNLGSRYRLDESEVEIRATRGSGPGGQHRNKTDSCIVATHTPSGIKVRVDMKSQYQSRTMALQILTAKLAEGAAEESQAKRAAKRKKQVGTGMRGDKIRTYREQDDRVTDHRTGKVWKLKAWLKGQW